MSGGLEGPAPAERLHPEGRRDGHGRRVEPGAPAERGLRRAVVSAVVKHDPGVLAHLSGLFARRRFNIEELTVGAIDDEHARLTLVVEASAPGIRQVEKQLQKLLTVVSVAELHANAVRRQIALVKFRGAAPADAKALADMYDARIVDSSGDVVIVEVTGSRQKVDAAIATFGRFDIREIARAGTVALQRGQEATA